MDYFLNIEVYILLMEDLVVIHINGNYSNIHITPSIWEKEAKKNFTSLNINDYTSLLSTRKHNLTELYLQGYQDALENKEELDKLFL